jgi:glycosyltransferase involved in cell wall biosynthesis
MKIQHITDYLDVETDHQTTQISKRLKKKGYGVEVLASTIRERKHRAVNETQFGKVIRFLGVKMFGKAVFPGLALKLLFQKNPDIVKSYMLGSFSTFVAGYIKKIRGYPLIIFADFDHKEPKIRGIGRRIYNKIFKEIPAKEADIITVMLPEQKRELARRFNLDKKKIVVIPTGIDYKRFSSPRKKNLRKKFGLQGKFVVMSVCFLLRKKNLEMALRAFSKIKDKNVVFLHVGGVFDQDYKKELNLLIDKLSIKNRVVFTGFLSWEDTIESIKIGDIYIQTSKAESYGLTILESMAAGKPPITTKTGVVEYVVKNGKTGYIIKNEKELINKIKLLHKNKNLRSKIGRAAKAEVKKYDWDKLVNDWEEIYKDVLKKGKK